MTNTNRIRYCTYDWIHSSLEWSGICSLPEGHPGNHRFVDTMGLCLWTDSEEPNAETECRASSEGDPNSDYRPRQYRTDYENSIPHNH